MPKVISGLPIYFKNSDFKQASETFDFQDGVFISFYSSEVWYGCICFVPDQNFDAEFLRNEFAKNNKTSVVKSQITIKVICSGQWESLTQLAASKSGWVVEKVITRAGPFTVVVQSVTGKLQVSKEGIIVTNESSEAPNFSIQAVSYVEPQAKGPIKVLVVDDSPTIRNLLNTVLSADPRLKVVGLAEKPSDVEGMIKQVNPDVMTLDIHMPEMDGVTLLKSLLPKYSIPTIMISSISKEEGPQVLNALSIGAVDYIQKPSLKDLDVVAPQIVERVVMASKAKVGRSVRTEKIKRLTVSLSTSEHLIVMGSSTGGTEALREVLEHMPAQIPPVLVVQHIPAVFSKALAERLNELCPFEVREAQDGDIVKANTVYIAPGGKQMGVLSKVQDQLAITVTDAAPVNRHKPSVDYLFDDVAKLKHPNVVGVIMTGMGADGAKGLKKLRDLGARTVAQDEKTCVVFGMPREAIALGGAEFISPLDQIALKITEIISQGNIKRKVS